MSAARGLVLASYLTAIGSAAVDPRNLRTFLTHPEFDAPKWNITVTHPDKVTPGYWFVSPYHRLNATMDIYPGWATPMIFDGRGQLVWSAYNINAGSIFDFKLSIVEGEPHLTWSDAHSMTSYAIDTSFNEPRIFNFGSDFDAHELAFFDQGRTGAYTTRRFVRKEYEGKSCRPITGGFRVFDVATLETKFEWWMDESVETATVDCTFDPFHINSLDRDDNGDWLVSARHKNSIFKISAADGHTIWALHGQQDSRDEWATENSQRVRWDMTGVDFARQHNVRFVGHNGTHELISILDNAKGEDPHPPSHDMSRALVLAIDAVSSPPSARLVSAIPHPDGRGHYTFRRGNYQHLPDSGNSFVGWSEQALHSEHGPTGERLMTARLASRKLGTYRSFKFPFVGRPNYPPRATSCAARGVASDDEATDTSTDNDDDNGTLLTIVHASWNGATEVATWVLYRADATGKKRHREEIARTPRAGFETTLLWRGFAAYVVVEARDVTGQVLGETELVTTDRARGWLIDPAVRDELLWTQDLKAMEDLGGGRGQRDKGDGDGDGDDGWDHAGATSKSVLWILLGVSVGSLLTLVVAWLLKSVEDRGLVLLPPWMRHRYEVLREGKESRSSDESAGRD